MRTWIALITVLALSANAIGQIPQSEPAELKTVRGFVEVLQNPQDSWESAAEKILVAQDREQLSRTIRRIRKYTRQLEVSDVILESETGGKLIYETPNSIVTVNFQMTSEKPIAIVGISFQVERRNDGDLAQLTWGTLEEELDRAAQAGFEGVVLVTREGKIVLHRGYGLANREKDIQNRPDTIFAIGSAPIDFMHAAILLLKDEGKLQLDDLITKFFPHVPEDKQSITLRHLMTGQSGLPDFHGLPSDANQDHTWIDRDEAVRRIFAQSLLFEPGKGRRHSHSAWGLLAAIVEIVSEQSYQQFTTERLFRPAGMKDTGFFGDSLPEDRVAVGYGHKKSSEPNSPPHWGKTSWLVMGSGGQVSSLGDLLRWKKAMRSGSILSAESQKIYLRGGDGVSADGDMFGFEFMHSNNPNQLFMIISNTIDSREKRKQFDDLGQRLHRLIRSPRAR